MANQVPAPVRNEKTDAGRAAGYSAAMEALMQAPHRRPYLATATETSVPPPGANGTIIVIDRVG